MSVSRRLLVIGAVLLLAGLGVGFWPFSSGGVGCGSAFAGPDETDSMIAGIRAGAGLISDDNCDGDRSTVRLVAIGLLAAGGVSAIGGWVAAGSGKRPDPSPSA